VIKALAASLSLAYSPTLSVLVLLVLGACVAAEMAWIAHRVRRMKVGPDD
jgi:hypothetical protein